MILPYWQYISQGENPEMHFNNAVKAIEAGCKWVQLRIKDESQEVIAEVAEKLQFICKKQQALLFINDNVQVTFEIQADGVHLGKEDMPPSKARKILGKNAIIGGTANTFEDIQYLNQEGVDYIGLGPFRFTSTKKNLSPILGLEGYSNILGKMQEQPIKIPIFAIGGIVLDDIQALRETGIHGIAVSGLVTKSKDKKALIQNIDKFFKHKLSSI